MKRKVISVFLALCMLLSVIPLGVVTVNAEPSGDFSYWLLSEEEKTCIIGRYNGSATELSIPSQLDGYTVTEIGSYAFRDCTSLVSITIPDSVTSIKWNAFENCTSLTSITIPDSVTSIGDDVFSGCTSLENICVGSSNENYCSIDGVLFNKDATKLIYFPKGKSGDYTIPDNVTSIGNSAFDNCTLLTSIAIPDSVMSIGNYAFNRCISLKNIYVGLGNENYCDIDGALFNKDATELICFPKGKSGDYTIPNSVTSIDSYAFDGCNSMENIYVDVGNEIYCDIDGALFNKDATELIYFPKGKSGDYTIPESMTSIDSYAFWNCTALTSITIPDSVLSIGYRAFEGCIALENVIVPKSVTDIDWRAFSGCTSFTSITIPSSVTSIGGYAFENCTSMEKIFIPDGVDLNEGVFRGCSALKSVKIPYGNRSVCTHLFAGCSSLTEVIIPDSVTWIGLSAFGSCESLVKLTIPSSVTQIGDPEIRNDPFACCILLTDIDVDADNPKYSSIDGVLFNKEKTELIKCPEGKKGEYSIPSGTEIIKTDAFLACASLTNVTIPDSVTRIGAFAFDGCTSLESITIPDSVKIIDYSAFSDCTSLTSITIPNSVTSISVLCFKGCENLTIYGYSGSYAETYAKENSIPFVALTEPSIVKFDKSQIRFRGVGADKDFSNYKGTFDVRTVAKISEADFRNTFGTDEEAIKNITDIGFIYAAEKNLETFDNATAKAVAEGTGTDVNYVKMPVSYIQHTGDGADYIFTCLITDVPDNDREQKGYCFAYVCCNGTYYYFDDVTVMDFNALYTANKPQA